MVVIIDNYDSFTWNLVQRLGELDVRLDVRVYRNDQIDCPQLEQLPLTHLIVSPGPCTPAESGRSVEIIRHFAGRVPILGVCLGHQCMAYAWGGRIVRARRIVHGKTGSIVHDGRGVFAGLPNPFEATRYHSLVIDPQTLPEAFEVSARSENGIIMAIRHRTLDIEGVQFHPESILTAPGMDLLRNFLSR